uniref:Uncharacterized protein n=1 Tax=Leersia perrieri TaxID=77586 RepID=A0A0D9Y0S8_9ORYZ
MEEARQDSDVAVNASATCAHCFIISLFSVSYAAAAVLAPPPPPLLFVLGTRFAVAVDVGAVVFFAQAKPVEAVSCTGPENRDGAGGSAAWRLLAITGNGCSSPPAAARGRDSSAWTWPCFWPAAEEVAEEVSCMLLWARERRLDDAASPAAAAAWLLLRAAALMPLLLESSRSLASISL